MSERVRGVLISLFNATCYGTMALFVKLAYQDGASPYSVVTIRFGVGMLSVWAWVWATRSLKLLPWRSTVFLIGWVGWLQASITSLNFVAFQRTDVSLAILIFFTYPVMVTIAARWIEGEAWTIHRWMALLLAVAGSALLLAAAPKQLSLLGVVLPLLAAVTNTVYLMTIRRVTRHVNPSLALGYVYTGAAVIVLAFAPVMGGWATPSGAVGWWAIAGVIAFPTLIGALALFAALKILPSSQVALIGTIELVVTVISAALWLGERMSTGQAVGAVMVTGAALLSQITPKARTSTKEAAL